MSGAKHLYIYEIPCRVMYEFTRLMDTLSHRDWCGFACRVIEDQTELRLIERAEDRTNRLMHVWGCRNGTVNDLLEILQDVKMLSARDIILKWMSVSGSSFPPGQKDYSSSQTTESMQQCSRPSLPDPGFPPLPLPGPPPSELVSQEYTQTSSALQASVTEPTTSVKSEDLYNSLPSCVMLWPFEEIRKGTENFSISRKIGEGGFGVVYRGTMRNTEYAVKKLKEDSPLDWTLIKKSFDTEVEKLSAYRHPNIMDLAGYSTGDDGAYCLLYTYMPNGSLEHRLHCGSYGALSWSERVSILKGTAKALQFLHCCSPKVIHGDVKSSNILLGGHLEPKLGDFGLARLCQAPCRATGKTSTVAQTQTVRGTLAYLPEEYLKDGELGVEIDVYSFGVVLLEVLTGKRAIEEKGHSKAVYLKDLVKELEEERQSTHTGKVSQIQLGVISKAALHICRSHLDSRVVTAGAAAPEGSQEIAQLACQCLHRRRKKRPPMDEVFRTLEDSYTHQTNNSKSMVSTLPVLSKPFLTTATTSTEDPVQALTSQFTKLGPQEDTYCCMPHVPVSTLTSSLPSTANHPVVTKEEGTLGINATGRYPCESDESQGFSQYFGSSNFTASTRNSSSMRNRSQGDRENNSCSSASPSSSSSVSGSPNQRIMVNPAKQHLVDKMSLYKKGLISSAELFSSNQSSYLAGEHSQTQEPEESDEFQF